MTTQDQDDRGGRHQQRFHPTTGRYAIWTAER
jgi:hypothetical protein